MIPPLNPHYILTMSKLDAHRVVGLTPPCLKAAKNPHMHADGATVGNKKNKLLQIIRIFVDKCNSHNIPLHIIVHQFHSHHIPTTLIPMLHPTNFNIWPFQSIFGNG